MGGGSLILSLYVLCAAGILVLVGVGVVLWMMGKRREARGQDVGRARTLERTDDA
jgi:hypothetical protein